MSSSVIKEDLEMPPVPADPREHLREKYGAYFADAIFRAISQTDNVDGEGDVGMRTNNGSIEDLMEM